VLIYYKIIRYTQYIANGVLSRRVFSQQNTMTRSTTGQADTTSTTMTHIGSTRVINQKIIMQAEWIHQTSQPQIEG